MKKNSRFSGIYLGIIFFLMYLPVVVVIIFSFNESKLPVRFSGFSLTWYQELFQDEDMLEALKNSLILGVSSCLLSAVIGTLGAVGLARIKWRTKGILEYVSILPLMIPEIILGMVLMAFFYLLNIPFGMLTLLLGHTVFCVPYILMEVKARLAGMDPAPGGSCQRSGRRFVPGVLGYYAAADHAGGDVRFPSGVRHVHGRCGDQYLYKRAQAVHAADQSIHSAEDGRYAGDQRALYADADFHHCDFSFVSACQKNFKRKEYTLFNRRKVGYTVSTAFPL